MSKDGRTTLKFANIPRRTSDLKDVKSDVQLALLSAMLYFQQFDFSKKTMAISSHIHIAILAHMIHESILHTWTQMFDIFYMPSKVS
jgi:hypothetical protein